MSLRLKGDELSDHSTNPANIPKGVDFKFYTMDLSYFSGKLEMYFRYKQIPHERIEPMHKNLKRFYVQILEVSNYLKCMIVGQPPRTTNVGFVTLPTLLIVWKTTNKLLRNHFLFYQIVKYNDSFINY